MGQHPTEPTPPEAPAASAGVSAAAPVAPAVEWPVFAPIPAKTPCPGRAVRLIRAPILGGYSAARCIVAWRKCPSRVCLIIWSAV